MAWPGMKPFLDQAMMAYIDIKPLIPTYIHLITSAIFPIYIAAHASLRRPSSATPAKRITGSRKYADEDDNEDSTTPIESLTTSDAVLFPILAGVTLTGLYLLIQWLKDPTLLNKILGYYFSWMGTIFTFKFLKDSFYICRSFIFPSQLTHNGRLHTIDSAQEGFVVDETATTTTSSSLISKVILPLTKSKLYWSLRRRLFTKVHCTLATRAPLTKSSGKFSIDSLDIAATLSSIALAILPSVTKQPWYLTNLSGFAFSYGSLQFMTPGTSATGSLLLGLLFFYDIYMVFYTPMMVTVATKLDVPIKLLIPRPPESPRCPPPWVGLSESDIANEVKKCIENFMKKKPRSMAMLGLGDIVIPGIMIAFALRFDLYNYYRKLRDAKKEKPEYTAARGMWAERLYTAKSQWSSILRAKAFPKPYFLATMAGYVAGMVATVVVMQVFNHAQPALLYLVPGVLSTFWGMALWRGEVSILWEYDEAVEEKEADKKEKDKGGKKMEKNADKKADKSTKEEPADPSKPIVSFNIYFSGNSDVSNTTTLHPEKVSETQPLSNSSAPESKASETSAHMLSKGDIDSDSVET